MKKNITERPEQKIAKTTAKEKAQIDDTLQSNVDVD